MYRIFLNIVALHMALPKLPKKNKIDQIGQGMNMICLLELKGLVFNLGT
jgi:hypothetical protein